MKIDNLYSADPQIQNCLVGPYYPIGGYWGERPSFGGQYFPEPNLPRLDLREDNLPYFGHITTSSSSNKTDYLPALPACFDKQVWFPETDGAYKFELEVPRYSRDDISVEIQDDGAKTLVVMAERKVGNNIAHCFTEKYAIPSTPLDLENASAKVENGLLTIFFPAKTVAVKTIKVL